MSKFYRGQPVSIALNGILVPGIVTDAEERDRTIITRKRPEGILVANSVVIASFRKPPQLDGFYMERAENSQFVHPRATRSGPIDGGPKAGWTVGDERHLAALAEAVAASTLKLQREQAETAGRPVSEEPDLSKEPSLDLAMAATA